jgi:hypothetical protein
MAVKRARGQDVVVTLLSGGVPQLELTDIMNFNTELVSEIKEQDFLGEAFTRVDDVFKNAKFDFELQVHSGQIFLLAKAINDRQKRINPLIQFVISSTLIFVETGEIYQMVYPDCVFGSIPMNVPARTDYVKFKVQGACEEVLTNLAA